MQHVNTSTSDGVLRLSYVNLENKSFFTVKDFEIACDMKGPSGTAISTGMTPEERQRIYREEQARIEARRQLAELLLAVETTRRLDDSGNPPDAALSGKSRHSNAYDNIASFKRKGIFYEP
jgi:hypothetical protein